MTGLPAADRVDLREAPLLGRITRQDPGHVTVRVTNPEMTARVAISDLVALPAGRMFLIGLVDAVRLEPARLASPAGEPTRTGTSASRIAEVTIMLVGTLRPEDGTGSGAFTRGAAIHPHLGGRCHLIEGRALSGFLAVLAGNIPIGEALVLGRYSAAHEALTVADGNRLFRRHVALLGSTGTGKSWSVALMIERIANLGHANMVVFDLHGEYGPLTEGTAELPPVARALRIAGPGELGRDDDELLYLPHWLLKRDELMALVLNPSDPHAEDQRFRFSEHMLQLKAISLVDAGRQDAGATFTLDAPIPYRLEHLVQLLKSDNTERLIRHPSNLVEPGPFTGQLSGLISRLEARAADPRYGFIFTPPPASLDYDWFERLAINLLAAGSAREGVKIIDLSEVPSEIVPLVVGVLARLIYEIQFWVQADRRTPVCLVCDEAHLYLPANAEADPSYAPALQAFESIAKEGRKHGVSLLVASQRPTDVSATILSQCHNFIVMRVTNDQDRRMIERLVPDTFAGIARMLPVLDVGEALVIGDALQLPTRFKFDSPRLRPSSATQDHWSAWSRHDSDSAAVGAGAEALRKRFRDAGAPASRPSPP